MEEALRAGFKPGLILPSPHLESLKSFVNPEDPQASRLHLLLQDLFPWDIPRVIRGQRSSPRIEYVSYRIANLPHEQPGRDFFERKRTYECLLKSRVAICEDGKREEEDYLLHLPWMTRRHTFVINGLEIVPIAQLLPATGILLTRKMRPGNRFGEEFLASIRPLHGPSIQMRCRRRLPSRNSEAPLTGTVQLGAGARRNIWEFFLDLFGEDGREFKAFQNLLNRFFAPVRPKELTNEQQKQREHSSEILYRQLFNPLLVHGFDFGPVGRAQFNRRLSSAFRYLGVTPSESRGLTPEDLLAVVVYLVAVALGNPFQGATIDDPEHLGNKRLCLVGDFLEEAFWGGLLQARDRAIKGLRYSGDIREGLRHYLHRADELISRVFTLGPLFQILDHTNPLAAVSHKRTVTLRGLGGVQSKYGNLEKRDVHPSHYGRLCPVETPESEDIGLTLHLAMYARVQDGKIRAPLLEPSMTGIKWLTPGEEKERALCSSAELEATRRREALVLARVYSFGGRPEIPGYREAAYVKESAVDYHDISIDQQLGLAACLIPFLSHSDAARVLMGAKNLKQALPLMKPEVPQVRTGMEEVIAKLSCENPDSGAIVEGKLALGTNLLVAYMPWRGYNFEDAIVASDRLVKENILTSIHYGEVDIDIPPSERVITQPKRPDHLDTWGLVKKGTYVKSGDVVLQTAFLQGWKHRLDRKEREKLRKAGEVFVEGSTAYEISPRSYMAHPGQEGEVIETKIIWNALGRAFRVIIRLRQVCPLTAGDKLMGRHGNKGVVGKIVPAEEMPTLPDGTPVDLVLNPHGVVSRMNLGQLYETHLGWVLKHREKLANSERARVPEVLSPFRTLDRSDLSRWLEQTGLDATGKIKLRDGANGPDFENPVVVGYQYIVKLNHRPEDKLAVRRTGAYAPITKQPVKGRKWGGGQRLGEMETWALQVHQVPHLLEEFFTTKADDVIRRRQVQEIIEETVAKLDLSVHSAHMPEALRVALILCQGIGIVAVPGREERHDVRLPFPFSERVDKVARIGWRYLEEEDLKTWDQRESLGVLGRRLAEAGLPPSSSSEVRSPGTFVKTVYLELRCGCKGFSSEILEWRDAEGMCCKRHKKNYFHQRERGTERWRPVPGGLYDPSIFGECPYLLYQQDDREDSTVREKAWRERFGYVRLAYPVMNPLTRIQMTVLPVLPAAFRFGLSQVQRTSSLDQPGHYSLDGLYGRVIRINGALKEPALNQYVDEDGRVVEGKYTKEDLQHEIDGLFCGYGGEGSAQCLEELIRGKAGIFRQAVLGKRTDYSGRAVIVPDPALALDECRLPYKLAVELFRPWLKRALEESGNKVSVIKQALAAQGTRKKKHREKEPQAALKEIVERILSDSERPGHREAIQQVWPEALKIGAHNRVCILNRAPTLHKFNLLAFVPKLWGETVIGLPPLVCAGFNADFDGDTMAVHLPLTNKSQQEARERLAPSQNVFSNAHGGLLLHLAQDLVAGLSYKEIKTGKNLSKDFAQNLRKEVEAASDVVKEAEARMRDGFEEATRAGLSFGIFDIPVIGNRQRLMMDILGGRTGVAFYDGSLGDPDRAAIAEEWKDRVVELIAKRLKEGLKCKPLNALALLTLSRARGDERTITQLGGMRGLMERASGEATSFPIEANFVEGLSPVEFFLSSFGSRASLVDKKLKVAEAGDFTRRLVNCAYNLKITCEDCGTTKPRSILNCDAANGLCQRCYGEEPDTKKPAPIGRPVGHIAATSIGERGTQLSMRTFHTGGVKGDNITHGLPHVNKLVENRWIEMPHDRWEQYAAKTKTLKLHGANAIRSGSTVRFRLGDIVSNIEDLWTIIEGEVYRNYKPTELPPRLFQVILRAIVRKENGRVRFLGLTRAALENLHPLERVAFRDAVGQARENAERGEAGEIKGAQERLMLANI